MCKEHAMKSGELIGFFIFYFFYWKEKTVFRSGPECVM